MRKPSTVKWNDRSKWLGRGAPQEARLRRTPNLGALPPLERIKLSHPFGPGTSNPRGEGRAGCAKVPPISQVNPARAAPGPPSYGTLALAQEQAHMEDIGFDPMRASSELWSFLKLSVTGNGRNKFDAAQELNGLDVWRRIFAYGAPNCCPAGQDVRVDPQPWEVQAPR